MGAECRYHRQFDDVGALLAHYRQGVALHCVQLGGDPAAIGKPGFGELHPAAGAAKQFDIEKLLEPGDLPTYGALGQG
ncbi:hypothetical protein D3C84_1128340 [compost metagenome]